MDTIEFNKRYYVIQSMGEPEEFIRFTIKRDLTKMTLKFFQPNLMTKMTLGLNEEVKSLMIFNTPGKPHRGNVSNQEIDTKILYIL